MRGTPFPGKRARFAHEQANPSRQTPRRLARRLLLPPRALRRARLRPGGRAACRPSDLSTDPYLRGRMNDGPSYAPGFALGQPIVSRVVGRVHRVQQRALPRGRLGLGLPGLGASAAVAPRGEGLHRIDPSLGRASLAISALGMPGLTAWIGAIELGRPSPGDTVYISSAAGAVGQLAGQFAKRAGARVVGSAGSDDKVAFVLRALRLRRGLQLQDASTWTRRWRELCPRGIDVYFDNVGGSTLEAALRHANVGARFPVCGMISAYNETERSRHPRAAGGAEQAHPDDRLHHLRPRAQAARLPGARGALAAQRRDGLPRGHRAGAGAAPAALIGMMKGEAIGKRLVQVAAE